MSKPYSIEDFYHEKFNWIPENLKRGLGHFNVIKIDQLITEKPKNIPFSRRDYYKISLIVGNRKINYLDHSIEIRKQALMFSNPMKPYNWELLHPKQEGYFCIFTPLFFHHFGQISDYSVFSPGGQTVFELTDEQEQMVRQIFEKMYAEKDLSYAHKYDLLRNRVFELLHFAARQLPESPVSNTPKSASERITLQFLEMLERQFPIGSSFQKIQLRSASDFAGELAVHTNHLNKALKATSGKTTTELIAERILKEAQVLLVNSQWTVSQIAYCLGFPEATHFNNFFKQQTGITPLQYRMD